MMTTEEKKILHDKQVKSGNEIGKKNLINIKDMTPEQLSEHQRKAQAGSVLKRKERKKIKDICNDLLQLSASDIAEGVLLNQDLINKIKDTDLTLYDLIVAKQIEQTLTTGSVKSAEFIRDSAGDKPTEKIQAQVETITDFDRELMNNLSGRLEALEAIPTDGKIIEE